MFRSKVISWSALCIAFLVSVTLVTTATGQQTLSTTTTNPNGVLFPNSNGASQNISSTGIIDLTGPFFQSLGTNGRSCATCHQLSDGMSITPDNISMRFQLTQGQDPIFLPVDGSNCNHNIDLSTLPGKQAAFSLLLTRGLIRIPIAVPANADYQVISVDNPYGCSETDVISMYRRPLPTTNLRFLSTVMWDGRESTPITGTQRILFSNYPSSLQQDLVHQAVTATVQHAQGDGSRPTAAEQQQIVAFQMALTTAQAMLNSAGFLNANGAMGGPAFLPRLPFFVSINSSINPLVPQLEQPGGLLTPGDGKFSPAIFNTFNAWAGLPQQDARASVARGQAIFNSRPINITGVAGLNDDVSAGGLVAGGIPVIQGTCGTCHDTPNIGNHSFPTSLNIGAGDPNPSNSSTNLGGLDIRYLPTITVCKTDPVSGVATNNCKMTTDLGQALIDGRFDHVGKIKGPILRGLSARAPYFHNGSAQTLLDVLRFYENRFGLTLTAQDESDLVAFLSAL
jgi:hypothetical protein